MAKNRVFLNALKKIVQGFQVDKYFLKSDLETSKHWINYFYFVFFGSHPVVLRVPAFQCSGSLLAVLRGIILGAGY